MADISNMMRKMKAMRDRKPSSLVPARPAKKGYPVKTPKKPGSYIPAMMDKYKISKPKAGV